jgi:hypothetical protein
METGQAFLTVKERQIPFVNHVKYLSVIFFYKNTRLHTETIAAKDLRIFVRIYPILKSKRLNVGT